MCGWTLLSASFRVGAHLQIIVVCCYRTRFIARSDNCTLYSICMSLAEALTLHQVLTYRFITVITFCHHIYDIALQCGGKCVFIQKVIRSFGGCSFSVTRSHGGLVPSSIAQVRSALRDNTKLHRER